MTGFDILYLSALLVFTLQASPGPLAEHQRLCEVTSLIGLAPPRSGQFMTDGVSAVHALPSGHWNIELAAPGDAEGWAASVVILPGVLVEIDLE